MCRSHIRKGRPIYEKRFKMRWLAFARVKAGREFGSILGGAFGAAPLPAPLPTAGVFFPVQVPCSPSFGSTSKVTTSPPTDKFRRWSRGFWESRARKFLESKLGRGGH